MSNSSDHPTTKEAIEPTPRNDEVASGPEATAKPPALEALSTADTTSPPPHLQLKLLSSGFSFFVAGANDGSLGTLIPYMLQAYGISTSLVATL